MLCHELFFCVVNIVLHTQILIDTLAASVDSQHNYSTDVHFSCFIKVNDAIKEWKNSLRQLITELVLLIEEFLGWIFLSVVTR